MKLQFIIMRLVNIPTYMAISLCLILCSVIFYATRDIKRCLIFFGIFFILNFYKWFKANRREANYCGSSNIFMVKNLKISFLIFLFSEMIFFFRFFWSYFHFIFIFRERANIRLLLNRIQYKRLALINTLLLLSRGYTLTNSHSFIRFSFNLAKKNLYFTLILGLSFILTQVLEYLCISLIWPRRIFSRIFFITTGFHGIHVIGGFSFLFIVFLKNFYIQKTIFELAAWYWHFVDVVWLFLFCYFYWIAAA